MTDPRYWLSFALMILIIASCTPAADLPAAQATRCAAFTIIEGDTCQPISSAALLQSDSGERVIAQYGGGTFTVSGTAYVTQNVTTLTLYVIEGSTVVGVRDRTRIVQRGQQVTLPLADGRINAAPPLPQKYDSALLAQIPLGTLPRPLDANRAYATPTPGSPAALPTYNPAPISTTGSGIPLPTPDTRDACVPRDDWQGSYTVRTGDVLAIIADEYNLTTDELAAGNCIVNPDRLRAGRTLNVPATTPSATPTDDSAATTSSTANPLTPTASRIRFSADAPTLESGECTLLRWDIFNVQSVTLDDDSVIGSDLRRVCPSETTTYTLRVTYYDNSTTEQTVTVEVTSRIPTPAP